MAFQASRLLCALGLTACHHTRVTSVEEVRKAFPVTHQRLVVSVAEQMLVTFDRDQPKRLYPVSTSRFGVGNKRGSYKTPLGRMEVVEIVGKGLPAGAKLKARQPTGEVVPVDAPGRDPIVTRVLRLRGLERQNEWALDRAIYIHGTPEESKLKTPASYGCVRMASADIIALCKWVKVGARVDIVLGKLPSPEQLSP
ncbi:L,D-transpeptidase [Prosthecobacter sp.]|uniref:L,D-transpeptidase n=1 Tax=Prosthecobacter sp. TaxID=1965333 RepID=UPI001D6C6B54|nr:L,D-transpeptidase [Prosthecobacter sp.]MCB1277883.1 L,D-transpeptidase [Prosthecobacter sp.]